MVYNYIHILRKKLYFFIKKVLHLVFDDVKLIYVAETTAKNK